MSSNYQDTSRTAKTIASAVSSKQDSRPRSASLHFIKVNPAGNITILVDTPIEDEARPTIANQLMAYNHLHAEQVGFLSYPSNGSPREIPIRLTMMGGEFCGNATRSAASYAVYARMLAPEADGSYQPLVYCSGSSAPIRCIVRPTDHPFIFYAEAHMPSPQTVDIIHISFDTWTLPLHRVTFPGITHYIVPIRAWYELSPSIVDNAFYTEGLLADAVRPTLHRLFDSLFSQLKCQEAAAAFGIMFYDTIRQEMVPVVYVDATESIFWEQSCASGTTAVGAALLCSHRGNQSLTLHQPGGTLTVHQRWHTVSHDNQSLCPQYYLDGPVQITAIGDAFL